MATHLGLVKAERFIALMIREPFDYTEWQRDLYIDVPLDDFLNAAMNFRLSKWIFCYTEIHGESTEHRENLICICWKMKNHFVGLCENPLWDFVVKKNQKKFSPFFKKNEKIACSSKKKNVSLHFVCDKKSYKQLFSELSEPVIPLTVA